MSCRTLIFRCVLIALVLSGYIALALILWGVQCFLIPNRR